MTKPCIITVAITGSVPRKEHNPAVPITIAEQVESTQAAFEAGATISASSRGIVAQCTPKPEPQFKSSGTEIFIGR